MDTRGSTNAWLPFFIVFRMRRDFECFPYLVLDIQDLFVAWKQMDPESCFNSCYTAIKSMAVEKKRATDVDALYDWFKGYDTPSLQFLFKAFGIPEEKDKKMTMSDWTKPLSQRQIEYVGKDAYYLLEVFYRMYALVSETITS